MIKIWEDAPRKISGETSLFLSFDYNPEVIDVIKECSSSRFDKNTFLWEVPLTSLAYLLDHLTYIDDITLTLKPEEINKKELVPTLVYKTQPYSHQMEAIKFGLNHKQWLLLDEPGLGKTLCATYLAEELKAQKGVKHCLIICGIASLRANWEKEIKRHSSESVTIIGKRFTKKGRQYWAKMEERAAQLKNPISEFFVILNAECLRYDSIIKAIKESENSFDFIIYDECHKGGAGSQTSKGLLKLKAENKLGMTGTLLLNSPLSAFIPLKWIEAEHATLTDFKKQYCIFGGFGGHQIIGFKNIDLLKSEIETCSLRRTKDLIKDLPPKNVINEYIELSDTHRDFYESVIEGVKEECDKIELNANSVLALTTRLRQALSCPSTLTTQDIKSSKIERCCELVDDIISQGDKVVILSTFKEPVYQLEKLLKQYKPLIGTGDLKDEIVSNNVDLFQNDEVHKVFIGTISKVGTGLTLNKARYLIMLDNPFTHAAWQQATDRIHRINNTEPVFVYNLVCEDTIDEKILSMIERKKAFSDFIVDDQQDENTIKTLQSYIQELQ